MMILGPLFVVQRLWLQGKQSSRIGAPLSSSVPFWLLGREIHGSIVPWSEQLGSTSGATQRLEGNGEQTAAGQAGRG